MSTLKDLPAGTWTVDVAILVSDFDLMRLDGEIMIRR